MAACVKGVNKVAVAYSGGLDSSILLACASRQTEVVACCGFVAGSRDEERGRTGARLQGAGLLEVNITREAVKERASEAVLPFEATPMDMSLWCLYSEVAMKAGSVGAKVLLLGQLADELFGGYAKYQEALARGEGAAASMMEADMKDYLSRGRVRDERACTPWTVPRFPYLAEEVVQFGLSLPLQYKIGAGSRKRVLRRAAEILGVPKELAEAPKKAAQYSSGIQKVLR